MRIYPIYLLLVLALPLVASLLVEPDPTGCAAAYHAWLAEHSSEPDSSAASQALRRLEMLCSPDEDLP